MSKVIFAYLGEKPTNSIPSGPVDFTSDANPLMSADEGYDDSFNQQQPNGSSNDQSVSGKQSTSSSKESQVKKVRLAAQLLRKEL